MQNSPLSSRASSQSSDHDLRIAIDVRRSAVDEETGLRFMIGRSEGWQASKSAIRMHLLAFQGVVVVVNSCTESHMHHAVHQLVLSVVATK